MASPVDAAFRRGLARILTGISLLLFAIVLALVGLPFPMSGGTATAAIVILILALIGLIMALTGYGEITEVSPPGAR
ncbi:MAG TPA: hypothetical protein VIL45_08735 [Thermoplasmata archaeon]